MKIFQVNCVYATGSTGKIVQELHKCYLDRGHDSTVFYGRGTQIQDNNAHKCATEIFSKARNIISRIDGKLYGRGNFATYAIIRQIKKRQPDIVHLHCINGHFCNIYRLLEFLKVNTIPTIITLHAEFMYTGNCGYAFECDQWKKGCRECPDVKQAIGAINPSAPQRNWDRMHEAFKDFDRSLCVVGVSEWISGRARQAEILRGKNITTIFNGLNEEIFSYKEDEDLHPVIARARQENKKIILYVTPYFEDENKGGKWILKLAEKLKSENTLILVAGNSNSVYPEKNICFLGKIESSEELAKLYSQSDVCVLTSKRETFSMVCAEALSCGTPVIGFCAGAPETIAITEYSEFVPYGDIEQLTRAILEWLAKAYKKNEISSIACATYSKNVMADKYLLIYKELLESMKNESN